jgi:hypothetical protein
MESWSWSAWTSVGLAIQGVYPLFSPSKNLWYVKTVLSWVHSYLNHNITLHSSFILIYLMGLSGNWVLTPNSSGQSPFSRIKWVSWIILVVKAVKSPILRRHVTALHLRNRSSIWRSWAPAASGKLDALEKVKSHAKQDCETTWNNMKQHETTIIETPYWKALIVVPSVLSSQYKTWQSACEGVCVYGLAWFNGMPCPPHSTILAKPHMNGDGQW